MSTIKSSAEHLTLNADGASKDIKFQANGVEKASISSAGAFTSTTIDATALTGTIPNFTSTGIDDNADATAITIDSSENVGIGTTSPDTSLHVTTPSGTKTELNLAQTAVTNYRLSIPASTDALTFVYGASTERMRIDSSGNVGIGTTSISIPSGIALEVYDATVPRIKLANSTTGNASTDGFDMHLDGSSKNVKFFQRESADIIFATNATERMRMTSSGTIRAVAENYDAGMSTSNYGWEINQNGASPYIHHATNGTGNTTLQVYINDNGTVGTIKTNGSATSFNTSSDYRLKENVDYTWDATTRLKQLKPARFNFIADNTNTLVDGFIAHEVSSVVPEAISGEKNAMMDEEYEVTPAVEEVRDEEGNITTEAVEAVMGTRSVIDPQGIDQSKLVPLLVKTIQELEARITALEA